MPINRSASRMSHFHKLDLASFKKAWFEHRRIGTMTWSRGNQKTGSIGYTLTPRTIELRYTSGRGDHKEEITEVIPFAFTDQPFGGQRRWFLCKACQRRCRVLIGGTYFRCRQCYRATYESQYETYRAPYLCKAETLRKRLGKAQRHALAHLQAHRRNKLERRLPDRAYHKRNDQSLPKIAPPHGPRCSQS